MRVQLDLDPKTVWSIQEEAERRQTSPGEIVRERLRNQRRTIEYRVRVRSRVLAGMCDADIAAELNRTPGEIARVRRGEGLPANPRYRRSA